MKSSSVFLGLLSAFLLTPLFASAQTSTEDVCCIFGRAVGESAEVMATIRSSQDCQPGTNSGDQKVCRASRDEANTCPDTPKSTMCRACGYFWSGSTCLAEDPVKKAKEQIKKEEEKKKSGK